MHVQLMSLHVVFRLTYVVLLPTSLACIFVIKHNVAMYNVDRENKTRTTQFGLNTSKTLMGQQRWQAWCLDPRRAIKPALQRSTPGKLKQLLLGLAKTIYTMYIRCFWQDITKYTVIYSVYIPCMLGICESVFFLEGLVVPFS